MQCHHNSAIHYGNTAARRPASSTPIRISRQICMLQAHAQSYSYARRTSPHLRDIFTNDAPKRRIKHVLTIWHILTIFRVIFAFCVTSVEQNMEITRKIAGRAHPAYRRAIPFNAGWGYAFISPSRSYHDVFMLHGLV